jgi:hypothetical protein
MCSKRLTNYTNKACGFGLKRAGPMELMELMELMRPRSLFESFIRRLCCTMWPLNWKSALC